MHHIPICFNWACQQWQCRMGKSMWTFGFNDCLVTLLAAISSTKRGGGVTELLQEANWSHFDVYLLMCLGSLLCGTSHARWGRDLLLVLMNLPPSTKASPDDDATIRHSWDEVLILVCCVNFCGFFPRHEGILSSFQTTKLGFIC